MGSCCLLSSFSRLKKMRAYSTRFVENQKCLLVGVPKGHFVVYVGLNDEERTRFVIPVSYLKIPLFQDFLNQAKEEFGYDHPTGGLTFPCHEDAFLHLISQLR